MLFRTIFIFLISIASITSAQAACGLSMTANDISIPWDLNFTSVAVQVVVTRSTADACSYSLGFTKGGAASYVTRRGADLAKLIRYQVYKDSGLTKVLKDAADVTSTDEVVEGGFQAGATPVNQTVNYYFEIPINLATIPSLVSAGTYTDVFTINLYEQRSSSVCDSDRHRKCQYHHHSSADDCTFIGGFRSGFYRWSINEKSQFWKFE